MVVMIWSRFIAGTRKWRWLVESSQENVCAAAIKRRIRFTVGLDLDRRCFGGGCCSLELALWCYFFAMFDMFLKPFGWLMAERAIF